MWPFQRRCPVEPDERVWIEESLDWLISEFGADPLHRAPVLPIPEFLPAVRLGQAHRPVALVATLAHELAHERLLGEGRIDPDRADGEPLTDLTTVFFGFGIFSANAAFEFSSSSRGWSTSALGYLTERMYGYALAYWSTLRGERLAGPWTQYLDTNPQGVVEAGPSLPESTQELTGIRPHGELAPVINGWGHRLIICRPARRTTEHRAGRLLHFGGMKEA